MPKNKLKTLIIGLDGATFDLILPWIQQGSLPSLKKTMEKGAWGELETVFPPITAPAWSSFLTGKNPGKHGIYDFLYRKEGKYTTAPNNRLTRKSVDFWEVFNKNGLSTGLINIPMTYPPAKVNGYMVTGVMTPRVEPIEKVNYTYPESLKYEIRDNIGRYVIHPKAQYIKGRTKKIYDDLINDLFIKSKTIQYLITEHPTDLVMFVIGGTDKIQHDLYHLLDSKHFRYDKEESRRDGHFILDYYKKVDQELGLIVDKFCDDDTLIVIMSDHGNGPLYKWIYLNNWLLKEGYLVLRKGPSTLLRRILFNIGITPANVYKILLQFGFSKSKVSFEARDRLISRFFLSWNDIDWKHTMAYSQGHIGQIFINKEGREPEGIVSEKEYNNLKNEIEDKLTELTDDDGTKVVERILNRDNLYNGEYKDKCADIPFMPYHLEYQALGISGFVSNKIIEPAFGNAGDHRMNGVFIIKGKGIREGRQLKGARIVDVMPNILFYNDLPLDKEMDGRILKDIYEPDFFRNKNIKYEKFIKRKLEEKKDKKKVYSDEDTTSIKKALKDLGYMG